MQKHYRVMKKIIAVIIMLCILSAALFSVFFITSHADHQCHGKACSTCQQIEQYANFFNYVTGFCFILYWIFSLTDLFIHSVKGNPSFNNLVGMKIRLNI